MMAPALALEIETTSTKKAGAHAAEDSRADGACSTGEALAGGGAKAHQLCWWLGAGVEPSWHSSGCGDGGPGFGVHTYIHK